MTGAFALLGLLHPDGVAGRVIVLGAACPSELASAPVAPMTSADVAVVAPTPAELHTDGWLEGAIRSLPGLLAPDGVGYLLVPPAERRRVRRRLCAAGLILESDMLHLPSWMATQHIVPLRRAVARRVFGPRGGLGGLGGLGSRRKRALALLLALPGVVRLAGSRHDAVALVVRRPGARPLFAWLFRAAGGAVEGGTAVIRVKWRSNKGGIIVRAFSHDAMLAIAKTTLTGGVPDGRTECEVANMERLGPAARRAGAAVPDARLVHVGERPVLLADVLPGEPASELLASRRISPGMLLDRLATWLEAWHRSTVSSQVLTHEWLERAVLGPARLVCPRLDEGGSYLAELEERCRNAAGTTVPLVTIHGDLTMSNVLIVGRTGLGVVDWEAAHPVGLPLRDFWYGAVDAVAAGDRYVDRPTAFARCFSPGEPVSRLVAAHATRLATAVGLGDEFATLCFHACWLQHAVDEQRKRAPGEPRPFQSIAQWIALHRWQAGAALTARASA